MGWTTFGTQHNDMKSNLQLALKRNVYNQSIVPVLPVFVEIKNK